MSDNWTIDPVDPRGSVAMTLIAALTQELARMYHDEDGSGNFAPAGVLVPRSAFLVGSLGGRPVACGAYRPMSPDVAEIKRMYVEPDYRGRGLGRRVLHELELRA
jgi:GNAT superfamily N-acetyltransferase